MVLVAGGIDLSVGATYALAQVIATKMVGRGTRSPAILVGIAGRPRRSARSTA